jgi:hypothetical protein
MLDPKALDAAFGKLTATLAAALTKGGVIAIDGKSLKGAYDKGERSSPRMMVSAYAAGLRLTLATVAAKDRNEVDAALDVLGLIDLKGKIVTRDAPLQPAHGGADPGEGRRLLHRAQGQSGLAAVGCTCLPGGVGQAEGGQEAAADGQDRDQGARPHRDPYRRRGQGQGACRAP